MRDVVIFGAGQVAETVHWYLAEEGRRNVAAFTVDAAYRTTETVLGLPVVEFETLTATHPPDRYEMFVAISYLGVNKVRAAKCAEAEAKGYRLTSHVSARAMVWPKLALQPNTLIMEANVIQPFVTVGRNV